ncbi:MAG: hypothetical protein QOK31_497 [Solirubrobacteraceae bacterium]|jgi:hypothetical protein|nr:hypothetical protein [Solirubrobacteraceae bacterium]
MKRTLLTALLVVAALAAVSPLALGQAGDAHTTAVGREIGGFPRPSCPGTACRVMTKTTGYNRAALGTRAPDTVPSTGHITSFSVRLGKPSAAQRAAFDGRFGSPAQVGIAILRHRKTRTHQTYKAVHVSGVFAVNHRFGQAVVFHLARSLPAKKGDVVAITVPTWAPILAVNLNSSNSWRSARRPHAGRGKAPDHGRGCNNFDQRTAHTRVGTYKDYLCQYSTAALVYSATLDP